MDFIKSSFRIKGDNNRKTMSWFNYSWHPSSSQMLAHPPTSEMGERIRRLKVRKVMAEIETVIGKKNAHK